MARHVFRPTLPRLLIAHNIEHLLFAAQAETLERSFPLLRPILRWERRRMERFETAGIRSVGNAIFLSSSMHRTLRPAHWRAGLWLRRPSLQMLRLSRTRPKTGIVEIGFVGNMAWWPNREGLSWFLSNVFPVGPNVHLNLFGEEQSVTLVEWPGEPTWCRAIISPGYGRGATS